MRLAAAWRRLVSVALAVGVLVAAGRARAESEWNSGLLGGVCGLGEDGAMWEESRACFGARGDVLWGRQRPAAPGGGLFFSTTTARFRDLRWSGGGAALVPLGPSWSTLFSAGPLLQLRDGSWEPGLAGWAFVGTRGFNYHGRYAMAWGLLFGYERGLGDSAGSTVTMGLQLDGLVLAVPVLFAVDAIRGPRRNRRADHLR